MKAPPPGGSDAPALLAALEQGGADDTLPDGTRSLLREAHRVLMATHLDAESARLRYHTLFDAVPDPVTVLDEQGNVLDINKASLLAYHRPREAIIGQPIHVLNPDLPGDHMAPVWDALHRGETYVVEVSNMRADGTRFPVEVHSAGFLHEGEERIVAVARDLSGRRDAELRYRELMEVTDKGILVRDANGHITQANPAAMRMFGIGPEESAERAMAADHWMVVDEDGHEMDPRDYPANRALRSGMAVGSTVLGLFHRQRRQLIWVSMTAVPQYGAGSDQVQQVLSLFSDVTKLKRDSTLFDRAQALAHIGGWEWDIARDHLYLTNEARRILGRQPVPATFAELLVPLRNDCRSRLQHATERTIQSGDGFDLELQGSRSDGHSYWIRVIGGAELGDSPSARLIGTLQDITERKQAEETLRIQAQTDLLSGLLNRDAILRELDSRLADPTQGALAVLYIDLDRFKIVNDILGHAAGDRLLCAAAHRIRQAVGSEGLIARFGGDEFLVLCTVADDPERPQRIAEAILAVFGRHFRLDDEEFNITASIGISRSPTDGTGSQELIQSADVAMYASKRHSRNGWQPFTPELAEQQQYRLQLETHLRRAVSNDEFHLVFQPQVELSGNRLVAAEALIRWRHEALGEMSPDRFIDHAESSGDIIGIGTWVMREACRQLRRWHDDGLALPRIAVNVSYRQFLGQDLAANVRAALDEFRLPGTALELEFTERVLIEDDPDTLSTFAKLREMGVSLSIDDFGEGYSALNYLRRLPIHGLKLSQLFVRGVPDNQSDVAVCQAVAGIARSLGLEVVAEGVETEVHRNFLIQLGVPIGQGFLYSPGLSGDAFLARYPSIDTRAYGVV